MKYIEKFYGRKYLDRERRILLNGTKPSLKTQILVGKTPAIKIRQKELNKYLELAFRHNIINNDLKKRLFSNKGEIFYQANRELMCAYFIEKILKYKISFYPKGSGNCIGEYLLKTPEGESIFIEVKSPIRETPKQPWCGNDSEVIKTSVKQARKQMPADNRKNMMILAGNLRVPISHEASGIIDALYGKRIITFPIDSDAPLSEKLKLGFDPSGMFQPTANTRIAAVATLEDSIGSPYFDTILKHVTSNKEIPINENAPMITFNYIFKVYHNPYAKNPIDREVFKGWPQFVLNRELSRMEWINTEDSEQQNRC